MYLLCPNLENEYYNVPSHWNYTVTCALYNIKISFHNHLWIWISIRSTPCNWTVDDPIFALLHLFCAKKHLFLELIFLQLYCTYCILCRNNFTSDEQVFLRILVINLRVLCFEICAIPTLCTPYYQNRLNLVSEICLMIIPFRHEVSLLYFSRNNLLRFLTYVCRHCNIKYF